MNKTIVVLSTAVALGLGMIGLYSSCGNTDSDGSNTGSFQFVVNAPGGFGLRARKTVKFTGAGTPPSGGGGCQTASDCPSGECSLAAVCGGSPCCLGGSGSPCSSDSQCSSSLA